LVGCADTKLKFHQLSHELVFAPTLAIFEQGDFGNAVLLKIKILIMNLLKINLLLAILNLRVLKMKIEIMKAVQTQFLILILKVKVMHFLFSFKRNSSTFRFRKENILRRRKKN
jgi:hypothetical protein